MLRAHVCSFVCAFLCLAICKTHGGILDIGINKRPQSNVASVNSMKCMDYDRKYARFTQCGLKAINRTLKLASFRIKLLKPPITNTSVNFSLFKRTNGYRPFFINFTIDACKYLAGKRSRFIDWVYDVVKPFTNINHTCPYESDIVLANLPVTSVKLPPLYPDGDYRLDYGFFSFNVLRAGIQVFVAIREE